MGGSEWVEVGLSPIGCGSQPHRLGSQLHRLGGSEWVKVGLSPIGWGAQPHRLWGSERVKVRLSPIGWGAQSGLGWVSAPESGGLKAGQGEAQPHRLGGSAP